MKSEQKVNLNELTGMAYKIAKAVIEKEGVYYCIIGGVKTEIRA